MTKKNKQTTYVALILDKSGSMGNDRSNPNRVGATIAGFNEQVQQLKEDAKDMDIKVCLVTFNGNVYEHLWLVSAGEISETNADGYIPSGSTAMYDALGYTIDKLQETAPDDENSAYMVVLMSDGQNNASKHYTPDAIFESRESLEKSGRWTFTYLGCSKEQIGRMAAKTGVKLGNAMAFGNDSIGIRRAFRAGKEGLGGYMARRRAGVMAVSNVYSDAESIDEVCTAEELTASFDDMAIGADIGKSLIDDVSIVNATSESATSSLLGTCVPVDWSSRKKK